jgi:amino acid adenylation domain-containing protein
MTTQSRTHDSWRDKLPADFVRFERCELERPISDRFERMVCQYPERTAIGTRQDAVTYAQLDERADRIAQAILDWLGPGPEPVMVLCSHGASFVAALLGVLKAGKFYAPADPSQPVARLAEMLADLQTRLIVSDDTNLATGQVLAGDAIPVISVDAPRNSMPAESPRPSIAPCDLAYVVYTSGSTGKPKGVLADQRAVMHYCLNLTNNLHLYKDDRIGWLNALTTNVAQGEIFMALLNGAALCPFDLKAEGTGRIAGWLNDEQITAFCSVPQVFRQFAGALQGDELFPKLRIIRQGGDRLLSSDVELFQKHFSSHCLFRHGLGAAEILVITQYFIDKHTRLHTSFVPLGYALEDIEVLILDDDHRPLPHGQVGEIAIRSRYMSPGYWRRPELTADRFLAGPHSGDERIYLTGDLGRLDPDSCLYHLGRKDFLVKVRGKLIAPLEVENELLEVDGIKEAFVMAHDDGTAESRLVAYLAPSAQPAPTVTAIRAALALMLSPEMVPAAFVTLSALPLNANNKADRFALPAPSFSRPPLQTPFVAARTPVEEKLAAIWREVLALEELGVCDPFLDLGGDSLLGARLVSRVFEQFGVEVPVRALLDSPTIEQMALTLVQSLLEKFDAAEQV